MDARQFDLGLSSRALCSDLIWSRAQVNDVEMMDAILNHICYGLLFVKHFRKFLFMFSNYEATDHRL